MKSFVLIVGKLTGVFYSEELILLIVFRSLVYFDKNIGGICQKYFGPDHTPEFLRNYFYNLLYKFHVKTYNALKNMKSFKR